MLYFFVHKIYNDNCLSKVLFLIKFCLGLEALNTIFIHVLILKWDYSESHFLCLVV